MWADRTQGRRVPLSLSWRSPVTCDACANGKLEPNDPQGSRARDILGPREAGWVRVRGPLGMNSSCLWIGREKAAG